ncbi:reverse transcriptase, putative [Rhizophagus irregularis DAOM 181602=DAOM 197198]|nr:reverse transcriptase, putative [Rhizophagus irregularis DAOM 181602=DAOM 197198]
MLTASIFDAHNLHISDHNPIITYFDVSLLSDAIKSARARQLGRNTRCVFKYDSISTKQIIKAANSTLPSVTVGNTYVPKKPKDLESLCQSYRFLSKVAKTIHAIDQAVVEHFQNCVPIISTPPSSIQDLPDRWSNAYASLADVSPAIFDSLMDPPTLDEWSSTISFMPNDKAPGPSMISYEMLKHLDPSASALLFNLICACLSDANISNLWRQATVFPIPKPHKWKCQLKNTCPITLLEVIHKALVKLFYNRLAPLLAFHYVLQDDILKAFDSVNLSMLRFALQCLRLPENAIQFLLSLFMSRSNRVITAHGPTPPYRVRIGIDQDEIISLLLWVIYLDPLLTALKNEKKDPYRLVSPIASYTVSPSLRSFDVLEVNNLVFMDDSTLISSSKEGMEHMLSITEEFYCLN